MNNKPTPSYLWITLGLLAIAVRLVFSWQPAWCETWYARGLYPWIRWGFDHSIAYFPFAGVYLFFIIIIGWLLVRLDAFVRALWRREIRFWSRATFHGIASFLLGTIFWFLLLWGYNYARIPVEEQLGLGMPSSMDYEAVWEEAQYIKQICIETRQAIPKADTNALTADFYPDNLEQIMRQSLKKVLKHYGYDTSGQVRGRFLQPSGSLLRFNSSGVYFPFTGEGHVDNGLSPISKPFTLAHELAHGYGFGSEYACNFWGFLACIHTNDPAIQYAGYLMYWRYVYSSLKEFMTAEEYAKERATISKGMHYDMEAIYANLDAYSPFIPMLQPVVYDVFLKAQGVKDGIKSYNKMVLIVASWRQQYSLIE